MKLELKHLQAIQAKIEALQEEHDIHDVTIVYLQFWGLWAVNLNVKSDSVENIELCKRSFAVCKDGTIKHW